MVLNSDLKDDSEDLLEEGGINAENNPEAPRATPAERVEPEKAPSGQDEPQQGASSSAPQESSPTGGKGSEVDKKPTSSKKGIKSKLPVGGAAGVAKNLASKFASFGKKNRNQIAIGGSIIGVLTTAAFLIFSLAPLKVVNMMENIFDYNWRRNNEAFEARRKRIIKNFLSEKAGITQDGKPIGDNIPEGERPFYNKVFRRMAGDNKLIREMKSRGYSVELDTNGRTLRIFQASYSDIATGNTVFEEIKDYDLLTDKASARKEINALVDQATEGKGWFKRIYEKRRYQIKTGTKWHWLDPIKQPLNRLKKKVATEVIEYALENKVTASFATKIIEGIIGSKPEAQSFEKIGTEIAQKSAGAVAEKAATAAEKDLGNKVVQKITKEAIQNLAEETVKKLSTTIANASNPVGWVLLAVGIVCSVDNFADNKVLQETVNGYASFQYMLSFTKWQSVSSQVKYGDQDGKLGKDELDANMELLTTEDGKDIGASNNYKRATGEEIPYSPTSKDANNCDSGTELCVERQPRCAVYSTTIGKIIMGVIVTRFDPKGTKADFNYCRSSMGDDFFTQALAANFTEFEALGPIAEVFLPGGAVVDGLCGIYNFVQSVIGRVFKELFSIAGKILGFVCGIPGVEYINPTCQLKKYADELQKYAGEAVAWIAQKVVAPLMVPVISDQVRGPQLANAIAAGADFTANTSLQDLDAKPLSQAEATASEHRYYAKIREYHDKASLADKIFSLEDRYSFASQALKVAPISPKAAASSAVTFATNLVSPSKFMSNIASVFSSIRTAFVPSAVAAVPYRNPFGLKLADDGGGCNDEKQSLNCVYGFSQDQLDAPLGSKDTEKMDKEIACSLVANIEPGDLEKPEECIEAENESNGGAGGGTGDGGAKRAPGNIVWPLSEDNKGNITSCFNEDRGGGKLHPGLDIGGVGEGPAVYAIKGGKVVFAGYDSEAGNHVDIDHGDGTFSRSLHLQDGSLVVSTGQEVQKGQQIGKVGNTGASRGAHLHLEIRTGANWGSGSILHNPLFYLSDVMNGVNNSQYNCATTDDPRAQ